MPKRFLSESFLITLICLSSFAVGCTVAAKTVDEKAEKPPVTNEEKLPAGEKLTVAASEIKVSQAKNGIVFTGDSPAETIRSFYENLRRKNFREAMMMTNLRVAVENLSDSEAQDLSPDFAALAAQIPAELQISGEIISGDKATVTVKFPNDETGALEDKLFSLERENGKWIYLMADAPTEAAAKRDGKNYFFNLRLEVHHSEAQSMIQQIAKAEMVYALQNGSVYADLPTLVARDLLSDDAQNADSTGYRYSVNVSADGKKYAASAEPAVYGKSGKLSFLLQIDEKGKNSGIKSRDNKGLALKN